MPRLSAWLVRASLVYFAAGAIIGALGLAGKTISPLAAALALRPLHVELTLVGWVGNLALGVGYWILPRRSQGPPRGRAAPAWAAAGLLNAGVLFAGIGAMLMLGWCTLAGRAAEAAAAAVFGRHLWLRARPAAITSVRQESS